MGKIVLHCRNLLSRIVLLGVVFATATVVQAEDEITIGSILILSGEGASWGAASKNGVDMAVEEINSRGGILGRKLTVSHQDDQGDPKKSISAFRHLTNSEGVHFIIGPTWSRLGLPLIDMATTNKVVMISPSLGMAKFNESSEYLFNTYPHDHISSESLADYVFKKGHRNVALVGAEEPWVKEQTHSFKKRFESLGGKIGFITEPLPSTTDLRTDALKISKTPGLEALVSTTNGVIIGSLLAKSLKEINFKLPVYSVTLDQAAIDAAQGGFEGAEFVSFLTPTDNFRSKYEKKYKTTIDIGADSAYDAVMMLADAMRSSDSTDPATVASKLKEITSYSGVSGTLLSDGKGGFTKAFVIKRITSGKPVALGNVG